MPRSARYGFTTYRRRWAVATASRKAGAMGSQLSPGLFISSWSGIPSPCGGGGKNRSRSSGRSGSGPPWKFHDRRNAACTWATTGPSSRTMTSWNSSLA